MAFLRRTGPVLSVGSKVPCPPCGGDGKTWEEPSGQGGLIEVKCRDCGGNGEATVINEVCPTCGAILELASDKLRHQPGGEMCIKVLQSKVARLKGLLSSKEVDAFKKQVEVVRFTDYKTSPSDQWHPPREHMLVVDVTPEEVR